MIPMDALAVTTTTISGSIQTDVDTARAYQWLVDQAPILNLVTMIPGLTGNLNIPVATGGATVGSNAEGSVQAESTPTIVPISLSPKTLSSVCYAYQAIYHSDGWMVRYLHPTDARIAVR